MVGSTIAGILAAIKHARREKDYPLMEESVATFEANFGTDKSLEVLKIRPEVTYELHMKAFQQAQALLQKSLELANRSAKEARKIGDLAGELFAQMNIGGHLLPALGECDRGIVVLQKTIEKAEDAMPEASPENAYRLSRVSMTCYLLLVEIAIAHDENPVDVTRWQKAAEATAVFAKEYKDSDWGRERIRKAQKYIESKS